jgi:hypothetical protein
MVYAQVKSTALLFFEELNRASPDRIDFAPEK